MIRSETPLLLDAKGAKKVIHGDLNWVNASYPPRVYGHFYLDSTNNSWKFGTDGNNGVRDKGSNFELFKSSVDGWAADVYVLVRKNFVWYGYKGHVGIGEAFSPATDFTSMMSGHTSSEPELMALGSTAISRISPTNSVADLPVGVAELYRDGAPKIPGWDIISHRKMTAGMLAGNYLNYVFAIKPLLSDMREFAAASERAEKLINDYAARSGRKIRRRYAFDHEITNFESVIPNPVTQGKTWISGAGTEVGIQDYFSPTRGGAFGVRTDRTTVWKRQWFSGAFTYHVPHAGNDFSSRLSREISLMSHLYGGISADTAWNLVPFSWAADWITNAGDVVNNISGIARDGLVMPFGYIMENVKSTTTRTVVGAKIGSLHSSGVQLPSLMSMRYHAEVKRRRKATPFGFGLDPSGFTTRQWAILVALGLTNAVRE